MFSWCRTQRVHRPIGACAKYPRELNSAFDQGRGRLLVSGFMLKRALDGFGLADPV
jgi:hypothetical protein